MSHPETGRGTKGRHHPGVQRFLEQRAQDVQSRVADAVTAFAGSMWFVSLHVVEPELEPKLDTDLTRAVHSLLLTRERVPGAGCGAGPVDP